MPSGEMLLFNDSTNSSSDWETYYYPPSQIGNIVRILQVYFTPVIAGLGMVGNIISFIVFVATSLRKLPSSTYLAALAFSDTGFLGALLITWMPNVNIQMVNTNGWCQVIVYITYCCSFTSVWYVVLFMFERYIVVCHPLKAPRICTKTRSGVAVAIVAAICMLMYSHGLWTSVVKPTVYGATCDPYDGYQSFLEVITYIDTLVTFFIPFVVILILNVRVLIAIRRFHRRSLSMRRRHNTEDGQNFLSAVQVKLTKTLVVVSSAFLLLNLPSHAMRVYLMVTPVMDQPHAEITNILLAQHFCLFLYNLTFSINFPLYSACSTLFRRALAELVRSPDEKACVCILNCACGRQKPSSCLV